MSHRWHRYNFEFWIKYNKTKVLILLILLCEYDTHFCFFHFQCFDDGKQADNNNITVLSLCYNRTYTFGQYAYPLRKLLTLFRNEITKKKLPGVPHTISWKNRTDIKSVCSVYLEKNFFRQIRCLFSFRIATWFLFHWICATPFW